MLEALEGQLTSLADPHPLPSRLCFEQTRLVSTASYWLHLTALYPQQLDARIDSGLLRSVNIAVSMRRRMQ